ncbi:hypothetical protein AYO45_00655 [Gammaproteobacteria bacterium SCGC AG-212-F23]|nr:hypothetical protein AYO45_00655 [Gammaproteobacteria bacterium SCGC AG-212-F23]
MKNILCYGDSNTWGNIAGSMNLELRLAKRYEYGVRWTSVLQQILGDKFHIIEAGLNGRTTALDEKIIARPSRNGLTMLPGIIEMHYPLDLVIFMLGTNDLKIEFNVTLEKITQNMQQLIHYVKNSHFGNNYGIPQVMLISPAPILQVDVPAFNLFYDDASINKSTQLAKHYENLAKEEHCAFLDAGLFVKIDHSDGVHIARDSHADLARAIAQVIQEIKL